MNDPTPSQRMLGMSAAILMLVALLTGIYAAAAMTGKFPADGHTALASHLSALMGVFLLGTVGWTLPMLSYTEKTKSRLALVLIIASFSNWLITGVKAMLHVSGIEVQGKSANDAIFGILQVFVVLPMIASAIVWIVGFRKR